ALPAGHVPDSGAEYAPGGAPDVGPGAVALDEGDDGVARHHPTTVAVFDALAHGQAVYTARPGLRQAKRWPYTWGDASHTTADPIRAGGGLLARRGAGRCDAASCAGVPPSRLAPIAPRPHRGAKGWAVLLRPDDRERGPRPLGSRPGALARVARDRAAGTGPDVSARFPASPFPVVQPHPSPSDRPQPVQARRGCVPVRAAHDGARRRRVVHGDRQPARQLDAPYRQQVVAGVRPVRRTYRLRAR